MRFCNIIYVVFIVLFFVNCSYNSFCQSNSCASATALTVGGAPVAGTCSGATNANTNSNCSAGGYLDPLDVWYKFTTGASGGAHVITLVCSGSFDGVIDFRNSTCFGSNILCKDDLGGGGTEVLTTGALAASTTYNVRIYPYSCCPATWTFTISVAPNCSNPSITTQPTNKTICASTNTTYSVVATGSSLTYQWQENGSNLSNGGIYSGVLTPTLTLTGVTAGMNGNNYRCVVSSSGGCPVNSNAATLTVNTAPSISVQPSNNTICVGGSSNMAVTASGTALTYNWQYNSGTWNSVSNGSPAGSTYSNQTTATMTVAGISGAGSYQYRCVISGTCAPSATSNTVTLTVNADPSITTQPSSPTICAGTNTNLSVVISNGVSLSYQWQYNSGTWNNVSNGMPAGSTYSNQTTSTISINGISAVGAHQYRCIITDAGNGCTSPLTSNTGTVTVNAAPSITTQPSNQTVCTSSNANFTVATSAGSPTYQWQMSSDNSTWFNVSNGTPAGVTYTNGTTATLTANGTSAVALYYYRCVVTASGCSSNSNSATLIIQTQSTAAASASASPTSLCAGASSTLTVSGGSLGTGAAWTWYNTGCGTGLIGTGSSIVVSPGSTTTYYVRAEGCNTTACVSVVVTVPTGSSCATGIKTFGFSSVAGYRDEGYSLVQANDGGLIFAGYSYGLDQQPTGWGDACLFKINTNGSYAWGRALGSSSSGNEDWFNYVIKNTAGNYIVTGRAMNVCCRGHEMYLAEFPAAGGAPTWTRTLGKDNQEEGEFVIQASNGDYIVAGHSAEYDGISAYYRQFYAARFNTSGNKLWSRYVGVGPSVGGCCPVQYAYSIAEDPADGALLMVGDMDLNGGYTVGGDDILIVKLNSNGTVATSGGIGWPRSIGGTGNESASEIIRTSTGHYVISGYTNTSGAGGYDMYILKLNADGTINWQRTVGTAGTDAATSVVETSDGNYVIAGYSGSDVYVIKLSSAGALLWTRLIDAGSADERAYDVIQTGDGGLALAGYKKSDPDGDILYLKLTADGDITGSCSSSTGGTLNTPTFSLALETKHDADAAGTEATEATRNNNIAVFDLAYSCGSPTTSPMPVELLSLSATACVKENCVNVFWQTATEINNDHFAVERSSNGINWNAIGIVKGAGNSSATLNYEFVDESPAQISDPAPPIYYRLKQTDYDSRFEYFGPISVLLTSSDECNLIIKNPVLDELSGTLIVTEDEELILDIIDLQGRIITKERINALKGSNLLKIELKNIEKGIYFLKANAKKSNRQLIARFVKM